MQFSIFCTV